MIDLIAETIFSVACIVWTAWLRRFSFIMVCFQETENVSDYVISFDDVGPERMNTLEYFVYHLKPYGIIRGLQQLNPAGNTPTV